MNTIITRRIAGAIAGAAAAAGIFTGVALGAPAQSQAAPTPMPAKCTTASAPGRAASLPQADVMTRAGQVTAALGAQIAQTAAVSCLSH